jgi:hypothetical protein
LCAATARIEALACEKSGVKAELQCLQQQVAVIEDSHQRTVSEVVCVGFPAICFGLGSASLSQATATNIVCFSW